MMLSALGSIAFVFWGCIAGIVYAYLGYPIVIALAALLCGRRANSRLRMQSIPWDALPRVTVLVVAYNAADHVYERLRNLFASDYPSDRLEVLLASDGSSDDSVAIARRFADPRLRVIAFPSRRGKAATLVDAMSLIESPVVVLTDVSTRFDRTSLQTLVKHFACPDVGLVSGQCKIVDDSGKTAESIYWRWEKRLRQCESQVGVNLGVSGAIYAVRRACFVPTQRPVINDDLVLPLLVGMTHSCHMVLESSAIAYAKISPGFRVEFARRVRIGVGAFQCLNALRGTYSWRNRWQWFALLSHKASRWICPFLMLGALISNLFLASSNFYQTVLVSQFVFYGIAALGIHWLDQGHVSSSKLVLLAKLAGSFAAMNIALAIGIGHWVIRPSTVTWVPTSRTRWEESDQTSRKHAA